MPFGASALKKGEIFVVAERVLEELRREPAGALVRVGVWWDIFEAYDDD